MLKTFAFSLLSTSRMSKTVLSRIKSLHNRKPISFPNFPLTARIKEIVAEVCEILRTSDSWEETLGNRFFEEQVVPSDIAHLVFDRIRDVDLGLKFFDWVNERPYGCSLDGFAYSSLLKLLAKSKLFSEVEAVLERMKCEDKFPTREALENIIQALSESGLIDKALEFYSFAAKDYDIFPNVFACNSLLNALTNCNRIDIARQIYDEMVQRDACSEQSCIDNYSTCIMARALCKEGKVEEGKILIGDRWGQGCIPNTVFYNILIDGYCKKGEIEKAYGLFKELKLKGALPTVETYGAMINGFCCEGNFMAIDRLLKEMDSRALSVNAHVYNNIIDAIYRHNGKVKAGEVITKMIKNGCEPDIVTYNTLISGSCVDGKGLEAEHLLKQAVKRGLALNKYSYTPVIHVYCRQGDFDQASNLLVEMAEDGHKPDLVTYGAVLHGLVFTGKVDVALKFWSNMMDRKILPDATIYNILITGVCKKGKLPEAKQLLAEMLDQNLMPDAFTYATLVDGFIRSGDLDEAKRLFEHVIEKGMDVVGYNSMIKGYCKFGLMKDAFSCMERMIQGKISPDEYTYSTIIDGYVKQHDLDGALRMFCYMLKRNCKPNVVTFTSLINGFCRKGDSKGAENIFKEMQSHNLMPNVITYSILIGGFCKEGKLARAASFFEKMLMNKCIPNDVTFHYLVNGFSNNVVEAVPSIGNEPFKDEMSMFLDFFRRMISDGWVPRTAAYSSILVCLCLHGMLETAMQLNVKGIHNGYLSDSLTFAALLHGICLEGRSKQWKTSISCNLNVPELYFALKYSFILDQYLPKGQNSEASIILQSLIEDSKSSNQEDISLKASVN